MARRHQGRSPAEEKDMKILHISSRDCAGGAGRAAYRLHEALVGAGIDSRILCRRKTSDDPRVRTSGENNLIQDLVEKATPVLERWLRKWTGNPTGSTWSFGLIPNLLVDLINSSDADVVHLHWVGDGYLPVRSVAKIKKPIVWTLHDLWPILGVGHYDDADPTARARLFTLNWEAIMEDYKRLKMGSLPIQVVGPSPWVIEEMARRANRPAWTGRVIPYGLDTEVFAPMDPSGLRKELGLDDGSPVVVFGALGATTSPRKGADLLQDVLRVLAGRRSDLQIVVFGDRPHDHIDAHGFRLIRMGSIASDARLAEVYSAGDVFLFPSREETFGQTASEALSCGTPVVGFRAAGQQSVFQHERHGYLAEPYSPEGMAAGVEWVIDQQAAGKEWKEECRKFALEHYTLREYAEAHGRLYKSLK